MSEGVTRGRAWVVWGLGAGFYAYAFFQRVAPSVMVGELMRDFALGGAMLGSLSAAYFYAYAAVQIPVGLLLDRYGPRRLLIVGTLLATAGSLAFGLAGGFATAALGRALVGAGVGFAYIATLKVASVWFPPRRFAWMAGLTLAAGLLGGISAQAPLAALVQAFGWRATMVAGALVSLLLAAAVALVVRDRPQAQAEELPSAATMVPSGALRELRGLLGSSQIWLLTLYAGCTGAPILTFAGLWAVPYLVQVHALGRAGAGAAASSMLAAWALGGPAAGWLSDRVGRRPAMVGGALAMCLSLLPLCLVPRLPLGLALVLFVATGLAGGFMVVGFALARDLYGSHRAASAMGVVNSSVLLFGAALQSLIGYLLDVQWTGLEQTGARLYTEAAYRFAFLSLVGAAGLALVAALALNARAKVAVEGS